MEIDVGVALGLEGYKSSQKNENFSLKKSDSQNRSEENSKQRPLTEAATSKLKLNCFE